MSSNDTQPTRPLSDPDALHATAEDLRVLVGKLRRRLREEAHVGDFTPSQVQVLSLLEREGPATVTTLARIQGMRPQSMGETLSVLKAAGLVSGAPDPNDGRQTERIEIFDFPGNRSEYRGYCATLMKDVSAETRQALQAERKVQFQAFFQAVLLHVREHAVGKRFRIRSSQWRHVQRTELSVNAHARRTVRRKV